MAQRAVCLCNRKYIGIETIYTVINGQQINNSERLKELRALSQNKKLFCPCGCGSNLILVAGDKNLREQHFRMKDGIFNQNCNAVAEGKTSVDSKIVLKCWLDDKLKANDIEARVPIQEVDDINRKYEFSFLSREKKIALSYCHDRVNLSDEKMELLENNNQGIHIIYVVDVENGGCDGQYPEGLMKVQNKQRYCLLLNVNEANYSKAMMKAIFYAKDIDGLWQEVVFAEGYLSEFSIDDGQVRFDDKALGLMKAEAYAKFSHNIEEEKVRRDEEEKRRAEELKRLHKEEERKRLERQRILEEAKKEFQRQREEDEKRIAELEEKCRIKEEKLQDEKRQLEEDFKRNMESNFSQQETPVWDSVGNRWIKCELCGKIAKDSEFPFYGGADHINLGTCKECCQNNSAVNQKIDDEFTENMKRHDPNVCPVCGGTLRKKSGPYGDFNGCSNYPRCRYSGKIRTYE